jgi:thioredoxin reductase (NADPH)|tara:strand:- start:31 stop:957 length:927 start_codon:yes stop_codon:yes gene_type:complete
MQLDLLIIGGGPAGLTAGIYGIRSELKTLIIEGGVPGGKISEAALVENYSGFPDGILGLKLAQRFTDQAMNAGVPLNSFEHVLNIRQTEKGFVVSTDKSEYQTTTVVIATGMRDKKLNVPGEKEYAGKGVCYCFTCDGPLFKGKKVAVIGSGTGAVKAVLYLKDIASEVTMIMKRKDVITAEKIMKTRLSNSGAKILNGMQTLEIAGTDFLEKVTLQNLISRENIDVVVDGVFIEIGKSPNTRFLKDSKIKLDGKGFIQVDGNQETCIKGIFAAGDVVSGNIKQLNIAAAEGAKAALKAYDYIKVLNP